MRFLDKIKRPIWYATYSGKTEITESVNGETIRTGEYTLSYNDPTMVICYVSVPVGIANRGSGVAEINQYGVDTEYQRYIYVEGDGIDGMDTETVLWIDREPDFELIPQGDGSYKSGDPLPFAEQTTKPDYRVTRVAHSFNHTIYEIKEY